MNRQQYLKQFEKRQKRLLSLIDEKGKSFSDAAKIMGISRQRAGRWYKKLKFAGDA